MALNVTDLDKRRRRRRHVKRAAAVSATGLVAWLLFGAVMTCTLNRKSVEKRFEEAYRDIAGGPRQEVYELVLRHERLVRALAARGAIRPPLVLTDRGVEDPLLQEAFRPSTLREKLTPRSRPDQQPPALARLLRDRNAELLEQLRSAGGSSDDLEPPSDAELAPPDTTLRLEPFAVPARRALPQLRAARQDDQAADQLKALCAAQGGSVKEFGDLCDHPEAMATRTGGDPVSAE